MVLTEIAHATPKRVLGWFKESYGVVWELREVLVSLIEEGVL